MPFWSLAACLLLSLPAHAQFQLSPVAFVTGENSAQPSVVADPGQGFVVTWQERGAPVHQLKFAVLDALGGEIDRGTIAQGENWFVNGADFPNLAVLDNGDWVSFWLQKTSADTYSYDIRTLRSRDRGKTWDSSVVVHEDATATEHGFVSMLAAGGDQVRLVWLDGRRMAGAGGDHEGHEGAAEHMSLRTATLGRDGKLKDARELDDLTCACCQTDAVRGATRTLVTYRDRSSAEIRDIGALVFSGSKWSKPSLIHADHWTIAACPVNGPALVARGDRFAVLWPTMAGGDLQVRFAIGDGKSFAAPVMLAGGAPELGRVDLATWGDNGFLATRVRQGNDGTELVVEELDAKGRSTSSKSVANKVGGYPRLARSGDSALLVWAQAGASSGSTRLGLARISADLSAAEVARPPIAPAEGRAPARPLND